MSQAIQEIPCILRKPKGSLLRTQEPTTCPYSVPDRFSLCPPIQPLADPF
jgi:hypothetical protein